MANIAQNESYTTGNEIKPTKLRINRPQIQPEEPPTTASVSGAISAMQGFPTRHSTPTGDFQAHYEKFKTGTFNVPANTQVERPEAGTKFTPIPADYSGFVDPYNPQKPVQAPEGTVIRSIPGVEGQYLLNKPNPKTQLKSARGYSAEEKALLLGNRSPMLYQVDHIIPIWAGGADTLSNKQVLANEMHNDKTRAQAVTLSLLSHGLITVDEARSQALQWKTRDLTDVPNPDELGRIPIEQAKEIQTRWDKQRADPGYGTLFGAPIKDIAAGVPETAKTWGKGIIPDPIREFGKGLLSGGTAGWIPYEQDAPGGVNMAAGLAGNIIGMLAPVSLLSKVIGGAAKVLKASSIGAKILPSLSLEKEAKIMNFATSGRYGSSLVKNLRYGDVARNTGAMVLYGQLSRDGFENRTENFWTNVGYGAISGVVPPSISGAVKAAGLTTALAMMVNPSDPRGAVINGVVMGALHGAGAKGTNAALDKKIEEITPQLMQGLRDDVRKTSIEILNPYLPKEFPKLTNEPVIPGVITPKDKIATYTDEELNNLQSIALKKNAEEAKILPFDEVESNKQRIITAFNQLRILKLPEAEQDMAHLQNIVSMQKKVNQTNSFTTPPEVTKTADLFDDSMMQFSQKAHDVDTPSGKFPTGTISLTGQGKNFLDEAGSLYYLNAQKEGRASPNLIGVWTPELEPTIRSINSTYTPEEIAAKLHKPSENPHNSMPIYGVVKEKNGQKTVVRVGWAPRQWRIGSKDPSVDQSRYSQNQAEYVKNGTFPELDRNLNKDTLSNAANENGLRVVYFNFKDGGVAKGSKKPYLLASINDENWARSIQHSVSLSGSEELSSASSLLRQVKSGLNSKKQSEAISKIKEKVETPAASVLDNAPTGHDTIYRDATKGVIDMTENALRSNSLDEMIQIFKKDVGINLTPGESTILFARKDSVTAKEILDIIGKASAEKRLSPMLDMVYSNYVRPYLTSPAYKNWEMSKVFPELRIVGGIKPVEGSTPVGPQVRTSAQEKVVEPKVQAEQAPYTGDIKQEISSIDNPPPADFDPIATSIVSAANRITPKKTATQPVEQKELDFTKVPSSTTYIKPEEPSIKPQEAPQQEITPKTVETPTTTKGQQVERFSPTPTESFSKIAKLKEGEPIVLKKWKNVMKSEERISRAVNDLTERGRQIIERMAPSVGRNKDTSTSFANKIGMVMKQITPAGGFTEKEVAQIQKDARARLLGHAEARVKEAISPEQEISFKIGGLPEGDAAKKIMMDVNDANIVNALGDRERAIYLLEKHPIEDVKKVAHALGVAGEDGQSGILSILKKGAKGKYGDDSMELVSNRQWKAYSKLKENEGSKFIAPIKEGLKKEPNTYEHAYAFTLDKLFKNMFGANYESDPSRIGGIFLRGEGRKLFGKQYELTDTKGFGYEVTHPKEFIVARAEGAKTKAEQFKAAREKQLAEETDFNRYKDLMSGSEKSQLSGEDMGGLKIKSKTQLENIGGLTDADIEMMPGATAIAMGEKVNLTRAGVEDARGFAQMIQKIANTELAAAKESGKKLKPSDRWVSFAPRSTNLSKLPEGQRKKQLVKDTDNYIAGIIEEYRKKFPQPQRRTSWTPETATAEEKATLGN